MISQLIRLFQVLEVPAQGAGIATDRIGPLFKSDENAGFTSQSPPVEKFQPHDAFTGTRAAFNERCSPFRQAAVQYFVET